jgi:hypothetical protein
MTDPQSATGQDHPDQPHHMTQTDSDARPTTPEVPPVPGADVDSDEVQGAAEHQPGAPAQQEQSADAPAAPQPKDEVTSPELEHLDKTIHKAQQAADEALAPQRD